MKLELTQDELSKLTTNVSAILRDEFIRNEITNDIYAGAEKLANRLVEIHRPHIEAKCKQIDLLTPMVNNILTKDDFLKNIIQQCINKHFATDDFKRLSISVLQNRINQIEQELYNND